MSTMKESSNGIKYKGDWQHGSVILQTLEGPIGDGIVDYPNGDRFEGAFHLSYAHINGPAYAADGRYTFADGSVIEHAWINTSKNLEVMDLIGIYRIKHAKGPETITPFYCHKRNGLELVLDSTPYAIEWYEGEKLQELEVASYEFEQIDEDCSELTITLGDGTIIRQSSGAREQNQYDRWVFQTSLHSSIIFPDGISFEYYGYKLKHLKPYDGRITVHSLNGKYHREEWKEGTLVETEKEQWDENAAKEMRLPDPFDPSDLVKALVWDGHIVYSYGRWLYDGDMKDDRPNGIGTIVGGFSETEGRRYEGEFKDGLCHGYGVFTFLEGNVTKDGEWVKGSFQETEAPDGPILLNVWLYGDETDKQKVEAKVGSFPYFTGFSGLRIDRIEKRAITFSFYDETKVLTQGETIHFHNEIDGPEDHDGCVYESYDYYLDITWKE